MKHNWIFSDIDGSLQSKGILFKNLDTVLPKIAIDNYVVLCTGRMIHEVVEFLNRFNLHRFFYKYVICLNGQQIFDIVANQAVFENFLTLEDFYFLTDFFQFQRKNCICNAFLRHSDGSIELWSNNIPLSTVRYAQKKLPVMGNNLKSDDKILKFVVFSLSEEQLEIPCDSTFSKYNMFDRAYKKHFNNSLFFENIVQPANTSKGIGAIQIMFGDNYRLPVISIGNGINDVSLFKVSDYCIAISPCNKALIDYTDVVIRSEFLSEWLLRI